MAESTALLTDFYEITMAEAALQAGVADRRATFELFARKLPAGRRYGVVAGTQRAVDAVRDFKFTEEQLDYLFQQNVSTELIRRLANFRFKGKISGYAEGSLYFPNSPILTVEGTFLECVLLETVLLSIFNHDSAVASAASRMVQATAGKFSVMEMGSRRTHEAAAVSASRAAYIAGFGSTSNIEAGRRYGIPIKGTSAHAFSLSFADEREAFRAQVNALGVDTTLLVDTYDIPQGIRNAIEVAGTALGAIRIDSGDLHEETVRARKLLDELGAVDTKIILSSDIDEFSISNMIDRGTPVDGVGAGTRVVTGSGHPTAGMVYKLVEREDNFGAMVPVAKRASGKKSVGGRKTAYRKVSSETGHYTEEFFVTNFRDLPGLEAQEAEGFSLYGLQHRLVDGALEYYAQGTLKEAREVLAWELARCVPAEVRSTLAGEAYLEANQLIGEGKI